MYTNQYYPGSGSGGWTGGFSFFLMSCFCFCMACCLINAHITFTANPRQKDR